ncbi:MAG TPA: homoserine kinase [Verrucomicrobiae bacterium]|nr:homoserine kinase [Verrucomicrobiae bacterium]
MKNEFVTVRVPGTTSNLGPGFDTLGVALRLYNYITVSRRESRKPVSNGAQPADISGGAMVREAGDLFFRQTKTRRFAFKIIVTGDVPIARGLGSSVTVRLGVVGGLDRLAGTRLGRDRLLDLVTELEHHPDNAAPALFGGFTIAGMIGSGVRCLPFPVKNPARFVALIPRFELSTEAARKLVPETFSKADTVHNLNRTAFISAAFASGKYGVLRGMFEDRVHQPYRERLLPQLSKVIQNGERAGAVGGWLSGSGSTIMCLATARTARPVATAMQAALPDSDLRILAADNDGLRFV